MSVIATGRTLRRLLEAHPLCLKLAMVVVTLLSSVTLALAVECIWKNFQEFRDAVNRAAFAHARKVFEQRNPGGTWNPSLLDSNNDGIADPLQASFYTLSGTSDRDPYACSEYSAYVHNVLQKEFPQLQKGDVQTVWNHNHSIIRLKKGLICDAADGQLVDGYRYVEPQDMGDEGDGRSFTRTLETVFDDPNPARSGVNNPKWFYDGPQGSSGRWVGGGGGGLFGGGNGISQGLMSALLASLMGNNGQPQPQLDDTLQRLKDSFEPSPTPIVPTPTPLPTKQPENTPPPQPTSAPSTDALIYPTAGPESSTDDITTSTDDSANGTDSSSGVDPSFVTEPPASDSSASASPKGQLRNSNESNKLIDEF